MFHFIKRKNKNKLKNKIPYLYLFKSEKILEVSKRLYFMQLNQKYFKVIFEENECTLKV